MTIKVIQQSCMYMVCLDYK